MFYLRTSVGVEIQQEDLLISVLQSNLSAPVFTDFTRIANFRQRDRAEVRKAIDQFFRSHRLNRDNIVVGVPRSDVIVRYLDLPAEVADNLKQVVLYQVQSFEPTEEESFYFDYVQVKNRQPAKRLLVLLVMIKKAALDAQLALLKELGIKPVAVTANSIGLANLYAQARKAVEAKTFILADLTDSGAEVIAVREGAVLYTRAAARTGASTWRDLLLGEIESAAGKLRLGPDDVIDKIVLSGENAESVYREMREDVGDCELIADSVRFEMPVRNRVFLQQAATSLGLAYSGLRRPATRLNLLPPPLRVQQTGWAYVPTIVLGLVILALLAGLGFREVVQQRILIRKLDAEIANLKPRVDQARTVRSQAEALEKEIVYLEGLLRRRDMNLEVLQELTTVLPPDTFLTLYTNREGSLQFAGMSTSTPDLIPKLERSPLLMNVTQQGTIFKDTQTGKDRFNFNAKLER